MKTIFLCASAFAIAITASAQGPGEKKIKYNVDYLEKTWGIQFKSASIKDSTSGGSGVKEIKITLEFSKDVAYPKDVRKAFTPVFVKGESPTSPVFFLLFDEENVAVEKAYIALTEGELTGKAGDAFRAVIRAQPGLFDKVVKIDARMSDTDGAK